MVLRTGASALLSEVHPHPGHVTVLWHSVMWQYLEDAERHAVLRERDRLSDAATTETPFAHVSFEPADGALSRLRRTAAMVRRRGADRRAARHSPTPWGPRSLAVKVAESWPKQGQGDLASGTGA